MADLLIKLFDLGKPRQNFRDAVRESLQVRARMAYEKHQIVNWVRTRFDEIGGAGSVDFYQRVVNAIEIPDSVPGIYVDRLTE